HILEHKGSVDVAYNVPGMARFRTSIFHSREKLAITMRRIIAKIPMFDELNLPPQIEELSTFHRGIVVVSGTTGSGKSTTLAAIIGKINRSRAERIITVEDPIEYQHDNAKSLVSQVEVGTDSESYDYALRAMMRQDPDTILIGEIRDSFSLATALRSASHGDVPEPDHRRDRSAQTREQSGCAESRAARDQQQRYAFTLKLRDRPAEVLRSICVPSQEPRSFASTLRMTVVRFIALRE